MRKAKMKNSVEHNRTFSPRVPASKYHFAFSGLSVITFLALVSFILALPALLRAQSNPPFSSPALDSFCYFPQIGDPSEMDTIVGGTYSDPNTQWLGTIVKNLGTKPGGGFGNMLIGNISPSVALAQVATGTTFNLHQMEQFVQKLVPDNGEFLGANGILYDGFRLGHFRDQSHLDMFVPYSWRIYWADDNGNYDSENYTLLWSNIRGDKLWASQVIGPYTTYLTNDTVEDIVLGIYTSWTDGQKDTAFLLFFKGGNSLMQSDTVYEDTSCVLFPNLVNYPFRHCIQGNFRGTGREDLIIAGDTGGNGLPGSRRGDLFFYANDPPFSLEKLAQAINYDTLMARWQNPTLESGNTMGVPTYFAMSMLPKSASNKSTDFTPVFYDTANNPAIYIFRGDSDFGSQRITLDSAAFVIHQPDLDPGNYFWPYSMADAGDMTGTGNRVLYTAASNNDGSVQYDNFFVTGKALDDKIDIYNVSNSGAHGDTLTANDDSLEDFMLSRPYGNGTLWLYYGSKQIPVRLNPLWSDVKNIPTQNGLALTLSPNPAQTWSVATIVWPEAEDGEYSIYDMLGRKVEHGPIQLYGGAEQQRIYFSGMPAGVYIYEIEGAHGSANARFVKLGGASSGSGTSQPSIIQQMKDARDGKTDPAGLSSSLSPAIR
jgi:hypothetical protein